MAKAQKTSVTINVDSAATTAVAVLIETCARNYHNLPGEVIKAMDELTSLRKHLSTLFVAEDKAE